MPDWNDPATWAAAYSTVIGRPSKLGWPPADPQNPFVSYLDGRVFAEQVSDDGLPGLSHFRFSLQKLTSGGLNPAAETLVVGCGFGWLVEVLVDVGANVWGTDTSTVIHAGLATSGLRADVLPLILNIDVTAADAADQFKASGAGTNKGEFRNIVTEHVLDGMDAVDIPAFLNSLDALRAAGQSNVYHLITIVAGLIPVDDYDPAIVPNVFTLAEWVALNPEHIWIDASSGEMGGGQ